MDSTGRTNTPGVEELAVNTCWSLLRTAPIGRLAVWVEDHPDLFPINFVVDQGTVVFRSGEGTKVFGALTGGPVAFEADGFDPPTGSAWSVVVKGRAHTVNAVEDIMATVDLPLFPWQAGDKSRFIRIYPDLVTGRRFPVVGPQAWRTPTSGSPHGASE